MAKSNTPKIRFKGFTDDWEQRKLGDILRTLSFKLYLKAPEQDGKFEIIQQGNDPIIGFANGEPCDDFKNTVIFGDHTLSLFKPKRPFFVATDGVRILQGINGMDGNYLLSLLERNRPKSEGYKRYYSILADREIFFTDNSDEQTQIGSYFRQLDNIITLHQRKLEKLKNIKKSCLEKMFPKNGEVVPEVRFKGFTDDWEQRKLTEFVDFFSGLTYTPNDVQENGTLVLRSSNVSNGEIVDADNVYVNPQVVNSENVKVGDIIVVVRNGSRSLIGKHAQIKAFMPNTVIGAFMTGIRSECPEFTSALLNTSRFEEEIAMNMGATINQITGYMFSKMEFKIPCLGEQKKIGAYFSSLDNLITLHQRKLEKLKNIKKSCLEKMFV